MSTRATATVPASASMGLAAEPAVAARPKDSASVELKELKARHLAHSEQMRVAQLAKDEAAVAELGWRMWCIEARIGRLIVERHRQREAIRAVSPNRGRRRS